MHESLFGSAPPMWTGSPTPGFGWPAAPGPLAASGRTGVAAGFNSPQFPQTGAAVGIPGPQAPNGFSPELFGFGAQPANLLPTAPAATGFNGGLFPGQTPSHRQAPFQRLSTRRLRRPSTAFPACLPPSR